MNSSPRLLIVEDEVIIAKDIVDQCINLGFEVCGQARNGLKALELTEQYHPDLILMDIQIDGKQDGIETASMIAEKFATPIVFLTAHSDQHTLARAKQVGPYGYILKPFDENALNTAIQIALSKIELTRALQQKNKELEIYNKTMSHDLKSPLRRIAYLTENLEEAMLDNDQQEMKIACERIKKCTQTVQELINSLLEISTIQQKELDLETVNMHQLATELIEQSKCSDNSQTVFELDELPNCLADYQLIYHVMLNLLTNAVKYSAKSSAPVIKVSYLISADEQIIYYIKDNGTGFDMAQYKKLFKPFSRLHSRGYEGTGLGLSLVDLIVKKHRGRVWADATEGLGSTFYFMLNPEICH